MPHAKLRPGNDTDSAFSLKAAMAISMAMDPPPKGPLPVAPIAERTLPMADHLHTEAAGWLAASAAKLLPPALGAIVMVAVDPPETKRELFWRLFVALSAGFLFGELVFDFLHANIGWFSFLDHARRSHTYAIDALTGGFAWSAIGGASAFMKRFRADPTRAIAEAREAVKP